ncbi:hypothetical protein GO013_15645 [Pseudodesulfovibrio sp. JC047]|uniref:hypothetical protein n=1 Tax=Pseudodesulfovibrio sp. JC047 TaxID=2683199 RepID=UPI0013D802A8|nr:hypothetical protein [Pseudodesulfovibrio sp. JC047]NDV20844.1 hypothetical protein [Pseudodesulfovibrio sp. JC047]
MNLHLDGQGRRERMFAMGGDVWDMIDAERGARPVYECKYFKIEELVDPMTFERLRDKRHRLWQLLDVRALRTLDELRERFGPVTVNDWAWGGEFKFSGLRPFDTHVGAKDSQHKYGRGFDAKFRDVAAHDVRKELMTLDRQGRQFGQPCFAHITCIEDFEGMTWFHFDTRNHDVANLGLMVVGK